MLLKYNAQEIKIISNINEIELCKITFKNPHYIVIQLFVK